MKHFLFAIWFSFEALIAASAATNPPPAGAWELQGFDIDRVTEVGEALSGVRPGRRSASELTVYKSTGHAVEDVAAARLVYDRACADGVGTQLPL